MLAFMVALQVCRDRDEERTGTRREKYELAVSEMRG